MKSKQKQLLDVFRNDSSLNDDILWLILELSGVCQTGAYSMFFWVGCS